MYIVVSEVIFRWVFAGILTFVMSLPTYASQQCLRPGLNLTSLDNQVVPLVRFQGKVLILAFWTTWCSTCRNNELPGLSALSKHIKNPDLHILAISNDAEKAEVQRYLAHPNVNFGNLENNVFFDPNYEIYHAIFGGNIAEVHPYVIIFNQRGCIVEEIAGFHDWLSQPSIKMINHLLNHND